MVKLKKSGSTARVMIDGSEAVRVAVVNTEGFGSSTLVPAEQPRIVAARIVSGLVEDGWQIS